ncbi:MAG: AMP-binding protein, partial [Myxococcota bacterium]
GSTGSPRGVLVTHGNLVANLRGSSLGGHFSSQDVSVSWLPLFHDMGLIGGPLLGLFLGFAPYLMTPTLFVTRPHLWLHAITKWRATFTVAPNFAYALAAYKLPDALLEGIDLSSVRLAFNGAEPINPATVRAFLERYAAHGFDPQALFPVYGLAEATLAVAFPKPGEDVRVDLVDRAILGGDGRATPGVGDGAVGFVSVGRALPEHEVIIRPLDVGDVRALGDREVGEVCFVGPSVSPGYYGRGEPERTELRTGDLGYMVEGEVFIVDRVKDLIIVAGQNHVPSDIERVVSSVDGVRRGRAVAFGVASQTGTEELHVVAELAVFSLRPNDQIRNEVTRALRTHIGVAPARIALVAAGSLPRTSSGKLRRREAKKMLQRGELCYEDRYDSRLAAMVRALLQRLALARVRAQAAR